MATHTCPYDPCPMCHGKALQDALNDQWMKHRQNVAQQPGPYWVQQSTVDPAALYQPGALIQGQPGMIQPMNLPSLTPEDLRKMIASYEALLPRVTPGSGINPEVIEALKKILKEEERKLQPEKPGPEPEKKGPAWWDKYLDEHGR